MHYDQARSAFLMEPARGEQPLIDLLSAGVIPDEATTRLPRALARLHQATYGRYGASELHANTTFRDFKLRIQYDDIAARLTPAEADVIRACKHRYQTRTACVTHGDPNSRNVVIGTGAIGLFDFEQSHLGAPAYDLAYIMCELVIATAAARHPPHRHGLLDQFLNSYFDTFDAEPRTEVETETTNHLAVQVIYRFWGPSRRAWTSYIPSTEHNRIINQVRTLLTTDPPTVSAALADAGYA